MKRGSSLKSFDRIYRMNDMEYAGKEKCVEIRNGYPISKFLSSDSNPCSGKMIKRDPNRPCRTVAKRAGS